MQHGDVRDLLAAAAPLIMSSSLQNEGNEGCLF